MAAVKIAFLGCAHMHANGYAAQMRERPKGEVEVLGVWDRDPQRAGRLAKSLGVRAFASREKLLAKRPHGALVCSENVHHREDVLACARTRVGVLCEKPLAPTVADARAMVEACREAEIPLMTAFPCRFSGSVLRLKELLEAGELGRVLAVVSSNHGRQPGGWFVDAALSGGGAIMDHAVHVVDLLRWLLRREFIRVYAAAGYNRFALTRKALGARKRIDDAAVLSLEMEGGPLVTLDCSWSRPAEYPTWGDVRLELIGTHGLARLDLFRQKVLLASASTGKLSECCWTDEKDGGLTGEFILALARRRAPSITGEDGLRATEVVEAAYRSLREGLPVTLNQ